jgi:hypothetical protein
MNQLQLYISTLQVSSTNAVKDIVQDCIFPQQTKRVRLTLGDEMEFVRDSSCLNGSFLLFLKRVHEATDFFLHLCVLYSQV